MFIETHHDLIETILNDWKDTIGIDFEAYKGHVYRMFNFCKALKTCSDEEDKKLAIAACFHDIGLWSAHTTDYLEPSIYEAVEYLKANDLDQWIEEISLMIDMHHKLRAYKDPKFPLVELFRKGDLVDFSYGLYKGGLARSYVKKVQQTIPNNGFHKFLVRGAIDWFKHHPLSPPPFMKW